MVLAILLGGIFGLLVAGGVLVAGTIKQARRDQDDINHAFAEARGEKHDPVIGPAPWSSIDMEALVEEGVAVDRSDPYATLTGANRSSMLQDVRARRLTEIDAICGAVHREGERRGIAAPLNQAMTLLVSSLGPR